MVERALERFGGVDVLVNNAGISQHEPSDTWDMAEETWDRVLRVNLKSVYVCSKVAIPGSCERGRGSIVNVASIAASSRGRRRGVRSDEGRHPELHAAGVEGARRPWRADELCVARLHAHADVHRRAPGPECGRAGRSDRGVRPSWSRCTTPAPSTTSRTRSSTSRATSPGTSPVRRSWSTVATSSGSRSGAAPGEAQVLFARLFIEAEVEG